MELGRAFLFLLVVGCGSSSNSETTPKQVKKGLPGASCQSDTDCASGVFCAQSTCDVLPCSARIEYSDGSPPTHVEYEFDKDEYLTRVTERSEGKETLRSQTLYRDNHRKRETQTFENGAHTPASVVRLETDTAGRTTTVSFTTGTSGLPIMKRVHRYEDANCPYGATGEILTQVQDDSPAAKGELVISSVIRTHCQDGRIMSREVRSKDDDALESEQRYLYDAQGRWIGFQRSQKTGDKDHQMAFTITRDETGRISSMEHKNDGDPKGVSLEVMDYACLHLTATGIERR